VAPAHEISKDFAVIHQALQRAILVLGDEPAVAADVGSHDDRDFPAQAGFFHGLSATQVEYV